MAKVIVTVDKDGNVKVEAGDVVGNACSLLTKQFENDLGAVAKDEKKPEFFQTAQRLVKQ